MAYATSHGQSTTSWPRYVLALLLTGSSRYAPEVPAAPGSIPSYAASYRGQGLPTSRPKRPSTPRERRRDDELGSGSRNAFLQNTMHLRQTSASVDGGGPRTPKLSEGQDLRRSAMANLTTAACLAGFKLKQTSTRLHPALPRPSLVPRPRERIQSAELFELRPRLARRSCSANRPPDCSCSC